MFNRRNVLGGIASATILAAGVLTAGTALAAGLPQVPATVPFNTGTIIPTGPMAQAPGVLGALQAYPVTGAGNSVGASNSRGLPDVKNGSTPLHNASGVTKTAQNAVTGTGALNGLSSGSGPVTANLPVLGSAGQTAGAAGGSLNNAAPQLPLVGNLTGAAPGVSGATGALGGL